jgi:hypothetical protein
MSFRETEAIIEMVAGGAAVVIGLVLIVRGRRS